MRGAPSAGEARDRPASGPAGTPPTGAGPARPHHQATFRATARRVVEHPVATLRGLVLALAAARGTFTWLLVVTINQLVLAHASPRLNYALLLSTSTNLHNLRADPLNVLVTSAFFVTSWTSYAVFWAAGLLVLARLEKAIGVGRWLVAAAVGHIGATLVVAWALSARFLTTPEHPARVLDVGVSYGLVALLAVYAWTLPRSWRLVVAATLLALVALGVLASGTFTDWGHLVAAVLGLALAPVLALRSATAATAVGKAS